MSEELWMTCHRNPNWAAGEIERLTAEVEKLSATRSETASRDAERMNWLARSRFVMVQWDGTENRVNPTKEFRVDGGRLRDVIDAALKNAAPQALMEPGTLGVRPGSGPADAACDMRTETAAPFEIERRERPTIMDGKVVEFAEEFAAEEDIVGECHVARGAFQVSASRNAVVVHRAECLTSEDGHKLIEAVRQAIVAACELGRHDRGNFR